MSSEWKQQTFEREVPADERDRLVLGLKDFPDRPTLYNYLTQAWRGTGFLGQNEIVSEINGVTTGVENGEVFYGAHVAKVVVKTIPDAAVPGAKSGVIPPY